MPVEAALSEINLCVQNPAEDFHFHLADGRISHRQILIGATAFLEHRKRTLPLILNVIPVTDQFFLKLSRSLSQRSVAGYSTVTPYEFIPNLAENRRPDGWFFDLMQRAPEDQSQIAVVFSEASQPRVADPVNMMRSSTPGPDHFPGNQSLTFQFGKPLTDGSRRHTHRFTDFLNRPAAQAVKLFEKLVVAGIDRDSHHTTTGLPPHRADSVKPSKR